jgi:hypothetical protein
MPTGKYFTLLASGAFYEVVTNLTFCNYSREHFFEKSACDKNYLKKISKTLTQGK